MQELEEEFEISKSARKREALEIFAFAGKLSDLSNQRIQSLPVDESIKVLILKVKGIRSNVARKRETQFLAKQLRQLDLAPLKAVIEPDEAAQREATVALHTLEHWRDRLIEEGDKALTDALKTFPGLELQPTRALMRQAVAEAKKGKAPVASRKLFKLLKASYPDESE